MSKKNYDALSLVLIVVIGAFFLGALGAWKISSIIGGLGESPIVLIAIAFGLFYLLAKRQKWL